MPACAAGGVGRSSCGVRTRSASSAALCYTPLLQKTPAASLVVQSTRRAGSVRDINPLPLQPINFRSFFATARLASSVFRICLFTPPHRCYQVNTFLSIYLFIASGTSLYFHVRESTVQSTVRKRSDNKKGVGCGTHARCKGKS